MKEYYEQLYANNLDNLDEMEKSLERNELPNLLKKKTANLTKPKVSKEIEFRIKNLSQRKTQAQISSLMNSIEHLKSNQCQFFTNFSKK